METHSQHEKYIRRCLELARKGKGKTGSNPLVGSVIVYKGKIIGEGFHQQFGGPHAEVNAINSVKNQSLLPHSAIYVNLEPCAHFGKTPPCSLLIKEKNIPEVVISMTDPNPDVSGKGQKMLVSAGIKVTTGILEEEARFLNRRFIINQIRGRPYVILKWAQSQDGYIDKFRKPLDPAEPNWITNHTSRMLVHKWRAEETGITVGVNTILTDNPSLNLRNWSGESPTRIIIDRHDKIPDNFRIKDDSERTWIFTNKKKRDVKINTKYYPIQQNYSLSSFLKNLFEMGISSLIVEGGLSFINHFICNDIWDEARIFTGQVNFKNGIPAPKIEEPSVFFDVFRNNQLQIKVKKITF